MGAIETSKGTAESYWKNTLPKRASLSHCRVVPGSGEVSEETSRLGLQVKGLRGTPELLRTNEDPLITRSLVLLLHSSPLKHQPLL